MHSSKDLLGKLEGTVVNFRIGPKTQHPRECIIQFSEIKSADEAAKLIGRKIAWFAGKRSIHGKIVAVHGRNGLVMARFSKGLPGQLGVVVKIIG